MQINDYVTRYVAIKRGLGYKFAEQEQTLRKFAAFADSQGDIYLSADRIIEWASAAPSVQRSREWISVVRAFSVSMHAEDDRHDVVPRDVFGRGRRQRPRPHILAEADIGRIMQAALSLPPPASLTPYTYHYMIGLMACTGLRVSEAVALLGCDLTADGLVVRETKFRKTRLVPIDPSARKALAKYLALRRQIGGADPHLFVLSTGEPPDPSSVCRTFIKLARQLGLRGGPGVRGPRLHDLRHSFAVRSLEQCGKDRNAIDRHMLALGTYLGHACLADTYWYLEATPVLTQQIAHEVEALWTGGGQ